MYFYFRFLTGLLLFSVEANTSISITTQNKTPNRYLDISLLSLHETIKKWHTKMDFKTFVSKTGNVAVPTRSSNSDAR